MDNLLAARSQMAMSLGFDDAISSGGSSGAGFGRRSFQRSENSGARQLEELRKTLALLVESRGTVDG